MKYILEKDGKKQIVEKKRRSRRYYIRGIIRWGLCIGILAVTILLCLYADKKLNDGKIMNGIKNTVEDIKPEGTGDTEGLVPTEEQAQADALTVCIDPGHGGIDRGAENGERQEAIDTLALANALKTEMEAAGIEVIMTREDDDTKVNLKKRVKIANKSKADFFISLHRNKGDGYGVETWVNTSPGEEEKFLSDLIQQGLNTAGVQRDRGIKQGSQGSANENYYVVGHTDMPACLLELGFVNNSKDNELYDANLGAYAKAITDAVSKTYEQFGESNGQGNAVNGTEQTPEAAQAANEAAKKKGMVLPNAQIEDVASLSAESLDWGQGSNVDEQNRPTGSLSYQEKYKDRAADFIIPTTDKKIYLTLDEGYEYGCTPTILNTLREKNVKAVFFVTKPYAEKDPDLVRQIIDDGHILGNHSVNHPAKGLPSETLEQQKEEVAGNHQYIKENFDYDMFLFRFPAGKFSEQSLAVVNNCGYRSVFWSFAYLDYDVNNQPNEAESLQKLMDKLHPGAIYLLHAESWTNTNILGSFIDQVRAAGYEFADYSETLNQPAN